MKKIAFSGIMVSILMASGVVFADSASLTTQGYVDKGLRTLYGVIDEAKADREDIPTKTSELTNDSGFLTSHQDISGKANAADVYTKGDVYTKDEVNARVANIVAGDVAEALTGKANVADVYSKDDADDKFITIEDANSTFLTEHQDISGKQDKIENLNTIIDGAAAGATAVQPDELDDYALKADVPSKTSELTNDSGFLTEHQDISGKQDKIENLDTIISGAEAGATAVQPDALNDYLTSANAQATYQPKGTYISNPELPATSGDYLLVVKRDDNGVYTYSWEDTSNYAGSGSGGDSGGGGWEFDDSNW